MKSAALSLPLPVLSAWASSKLSKGSEEAGSQFFHCQVLTCLRALNGSCSLRWMVPRLAPSSCARCVRCVLHLAPLVPLLTILMHRLGAGLGN